jgi:hypothetical protein
VLYFKADNGDTADDQSEEKIRSPVECKVQLLDGSDYEVTVSVIGLTYCNFV